MITQIVQKFLTGIFQAMSSSLGNLYATERREKSEYVFRCLNFLNNYLVVTCSVCFLSLFPGFITLWAGPDYLLPDWVTVVIVANFTTNYWQNVVQILLKLVSVEDLFVLLEKLKVSVEDKLLLLSKLLKHEMNIIKKQEFMYQFVQMVVLFMIII